MALSVPARGLWLDGVTETAQDLRLQAISALLSSTMPSGSTGIASRPGVRHTSFFPLLVQAASGMNITVNAGDCFVQGTAAANSGVYTVVLDTTSTITVATSDPTNPRIDNVIVQITDVGTSSSTIVVTLQTGIPAPSPVAPALPANSLLLATVNVAAATSTIVAGNITDARVFTVALGGIVPVLNMTPGAASIGSNGQYIHDIVPGRLRVNRGNSVVEQPRIAAFAPQSATVATGTATVGSFATLVTTSSVTFDGNTEAMIYASWGSIQPPGAVAVGDFVTIAVLMDGSGGLGPSATTTFKAESTNLNVADGGSMIVWVTPAAGAHTFSIAAQSTGHAFVLNGPYIRVACSLQQ